MSAPARLPSVSNAPVILLAAPNAPGPAVAKALAERGVVCALGFDLAALLQHLTQATRHRATDWQGVDPRPTPWIERAIAGFAPDAIAALTARERGLQKRPEARLLLRADSNAQRCGELAALLPGALWLEVVADGLDADAEVSNGDESAGFAWAETWSAAVAPVRRLAGTLGERVYTLRADDLARDPRGRLDSICAWLGFDRSPSLAAAAARSARRVAGRAATGFAAHPRAAQCMEALGYAGPTFTLAALSPEVLVARARALIELGEWGEAEAALQCAPPSAATANAFGALRAGQGRIEDAKSAYLRALQLDETLSDPFVALFEGGDDWVHELAPFARRHPDLAVRAALARWLVRRGLDAEAAEVVAMVEHHAWRSGPAGAIR